MVDKHNCELCEKEDEIVEANNKLDGIWMCIPCIEAYNCAAKKEVNRLKEGKELARGKPAPLPVVLPAFTNGAESLLNNLSLVMSALLSGNINAQQANAACNVSTEMIKVMELQWRVSKK